MKFLSFKDNMEKAVAKEKKSALMKTQISLSELEQQERTIKKVTTTRDLYYGDKVIARKVLALRNGNLNKTRRQKAASMHADQRLPPITEGAREVKNVNRDLNHTTGLFKKYMEE